MKKLSFLKLMLIAHLVVMSCIGYFLYDIKDSMSNAGYLFETNLLLGGIEKTLEDIEKSVFKVYDELADTNDSLSEIDKTLMLIIK